MSKIPVIAFPEESSLPKLKRVQHPALKFIKVLSRSTLSITTIILLIFKFFIQPNLQTILNNRFELHNFVYNKLKILHKSLQQRVKNANVMKISYNGKTLIDRNISTDDVIIEETKQSEYEHFKRDTKRRSYQASFTIEKNGKEIETNINNNNSNTDVDMNHNTYSDINEKVNYTTSKLVKGIESLRTNLKQLKVTEYNQLSSSSSSLGNYSSGNSEMNALLFQIKQFRNYLEVVTSEHPREMLFKKPISHIQVGRRNSTKIQKYNYLDILNDNLDELRHKLDS